MMNFFKSILQDPTVTLWINKMTIDKYMDDKFLGNSTINYLIITKIYFIFNGPLQEKMNVAMLNINSHYIMLQ
jgi:hypothetical protein